jgi:menaquinone-9 beta-reductase
VEVDVAVIGGGPAGATLAALLARRGVSVVLIDRDEFPRDKLCGEFLSYDALPILDPLGALVEIDERHGAPRITHCRIVGRSDTYELELPHAARGVSRLLLDDLLVRIAARHGAIRLDGWTAESIANDTVTIRRGEAMLVVKAKVVAGAWGRWGRFDTQLGRAFVSDRRHRNFGFKRHYFAARQPDAIELYSFRRGYLGVNAIEGGLTNICGLVHASRLAGHKGRWDAFVTAIRGEEPQLETLYARHEPAQDGFLSSEPVIFRARSAVEGGIFMIGDASGVLDPLTGNGMAMAVQSALVVAPMLIRALESPGERASIEREYRRRHRAMFAPRIAWSRRVAALLSRPRLLDALMKRIHSRRPGELFLNRTRAAYEDVERMAAHWFAV